MLLEFLAYAANFFTPVDIQWPSGRGQAPLITPSKPTLHEGLKGPIFKPPSGGVTGPDADFECDYSSMIGWEPCSTANDRTCWLRNTKTGEQYDIKTDYEDIKKTPKGTNRFYTLDLKDGSVNADGVNFPEAKMFNGSYPGPWIQACWGDTVTVTVHNRLKSNGTSIHWHGIRQYMTNNMDGVNGVSQCPIAPGDSFTYTWRALQYGSSWYHSHYSVQYADGAAAPMTLHGPTSEPYDEAKRPLLMTDWGHNSAFNALTNGKPANADALVDESTLLNGIGNVTRFNNTIKNSLPIPKPYTLQFDPAPTNGNPKRYLLRIINTSFASTFVFSIDNHYLQVVGADFVPIHSYNQTSILVSIGQRYHVIVTAKPQQQNGVPLPSDGNYWIRVWRADCFVVDFPKGDAGYEKLGILRYGNSNATPSTSAWNVSLTCSDEPYSKLQPIVPWKVGPANNSVDGKIGEEFQVRFSPNGQSIFPLAKFSLGGNKFDPLRIDYSNPTLLNLNYTGDWPPLWVVVPESYTSKDWVYMVLSNAGGGDAHPIHLHGHDFAILQQIENSTFPANLNLTYNNPPRRDVVLLPRAGYVVIAFKTDNPGSWLIHCHIAVHASFGLAMQVLERQQAAASLWPSLETSPALQTAQDVCNNWNRWWGDCKNWWPGDGSSCKLGDPGFSPDSGI